MSAQKVDWVVMAAASGFENALVKIAQGAADPVAIAEEALGGSFAEGFRRAVADAIDQGDEDIQHWTDQAREAGSRYVEQRRMEN